MQHTPSRFRFLRVETALALVFAAAFAGTALRPQAPVAEPSRIATIDLEKTFNSLQRYADAQASVKSIADEAERQVKEVETNVRELESELDSYKAGSEAQLAAIAKLQTAVGELRAMQKFAADKVERERAKALRETYLAIKDAARRLSEREGFDYLVLDDSLPEMDPSSAAKTMQQISARKFLFASAKSDVTDRLIGFMNDEWKAGKGG